ncbi:proteinaceous RNase P 1, chloroplastic/mitochondrial-like isoform X2 [Durio zibethinus]|uniref:ribonuclease P n=1 Tax=Durio zibethinus TaxID=66656 RepID=A0A6P5XQ03_DURZI|nr:proteinaceous RNase P 1, chloroplastic/mitochondrial-like isoform X2 [Durio zibethinus]
MASFSFRTLQHQGHLLSITLCEYPSSFTAFNFPCFSHFLDRSPPKHKISLLFVDRRHVRVRQQFHAKLPTKDCETLRKTGNSRSKKEAGSGFSSLRSENEGAERNSLENLSCSVLEEKAEEKRYAKDNNARKREKLFKEGREMGSGNSSLRVEDENMGVKFKSSNTMNNSVAKNGDGVVGEKKVGKRSKKDKANAPEVHLRVQLEMCSKRGDVMGAIQLYDEALREGMTMGQYHYAVLLYLCSSAAVGFVQRAKSGSGSRTLNMLHVSNGASNENSIGLGESIDEDSENSSSSELSNPLLNNGKLVDSGRSQENSEKMEAKFSKRFDNLDNSFPGKNLIQFSNGSVKPYSQLSVGSSSQKKGDEDHLDKIDGSSSDQEGYKIWVSEDVKKYALLKGFEIYEKMCSDNVPMNEATLTAVARMAMSMGNGEMAFDMVKQMKPLGINPRLRSYGPALSVFCNTGDVDKAFDVEKHMLEHGVQPEKPELEALLRVSEEAGKGDKVYYLLHKLRTSVRLVSISTADIIVRWFEGKAASRVGKRTMDQRLIKEAIENGGGGWHGQGWLGKGRWNVSDTAVGDDGLCKCCGEKLALIDLDPVETEKFAELVASIAIKRDKNFSFQKFQKWLDYYGPFEAVVDAANVGLLNQRRFMPSKVNSVVDGIRRKLPSKKWPLIVLHNKRITARKKDKPVYKALLEKWKNADALYATPTGSNDDWYWLFAAIKFKCLIVTNDEMRDHTFQLLGNDFFPKWKERHQFFESWSSFFHASSLFCCNSGIRERSLAYSH